MIIIKRLLALVAMSICIAPADASNAGPGTISNVYHVASYGGVVLFDTSGARGSPPSCQSSSVPRRWAINTSNIAGQSALAALMTALAMHKSIQIYGTGTCSAWGDTETADYFLIID